MKKRVFFMAILMAIVTMSVVSCEEMPGDAQTAERVDLYYHAQAYENDTLQSSRHFVIDFVTIKRGEDAHEYMIVKSGGGTYLGLSHWAGCKFCKEKKAASDPYAPLDYESVFGKPEEKSTWTW